MSLKPYFSTRLTEAARIAVGTVHVKGKGRILLYAGLVVVAQLLAPETYRYRSRRIDALVDNHVTNATASGEVVSGPNAR
jgi:hypothetical protein